MFEFFCCYYYYNYNYLDVYSGFMLTRILDIRCSDSRGGTGPSVLTRDSPSVPEQLIQSSEPHFLFGGFHPDLLF